MTTYQQAEGDVLKVLNEAIGKWHNDLSDAGVRIGVLMATNPAGPAVKHGGYSAYATVKIVALKDRVLKPVDCEILIDQHEWDHLKAGHRLALIDHELSHIELVRHEETRQVIRDDLNRPKLKSKKGDWNGGDGFAEVVERHKGFAIEVLNSHKVQAAVEAAMNQQALPFEE